MNLRKAVAYCRFSSDNQRQESVMAQERAIREYCGRNGLLLLRTYADEAMTGTNDKREQFLAMIADSKNGEFDSVIVHKLDRFSRDRYDTAFYKRELRKNNVALFSVLENIDGSPESIILESVITGMAEYYSKNLAREVMKGMRETAYQCKHVGGKPPFGYSVNPETRKYEIVEREAEGVRFIFDSVIEGKGYDRIIRELNARGFMTRSGRSFGKNSIHEILRNEKYKGNYVFNRKTAKDVSGMRNNHTDKDEDQIIRIEGGMPRIIEDKTFTAASAIICGRKKTERNGQAKESYLLSGKIFCGECGHSFGGARKFSGRNKTLYVTYRCFNRDRTADAVCTNKEIGRDRIEKFVVNELVDKVFNESLYKQWLREYEKDRSAREKVGGGEIRDIEKTLENLNEQIGNIVLGIAQNSNTSRAMYDKLSELEVRKAETEAELVRSRSLMQIPDVTEEDLRVAYDRAREMLRSGTLPEIRQVINLYVQKVVVYREHVEVYYHVLPVFASINQGILKSGRNEMRSIIKCVSFKVCI
jgi:site-specific DNA recombinase